jgi:penicillin-binding protein 2
VCVALAALEHGVVTAEQRVSCPGHYSFGSRTWYCWKKGGHGSLDIVNAIAQSCDVFFYEMARRLGVDRIAATAHELNLGLLTGIGLMGEQKGLVPTEAWKRTVRGEKWHQGETLNVGIGQGQVNVTPIQLLTFVSRVANGGLAVKPTLLRASSPVTENADGIPSVARNLQSLGISPQDAALVQRGMLGAVSGGGTAGRAQLRMTDPDKADWKMAGKTGTAQTYALSRAERAQGERKQDGLAWKLRDHALFIGFAPFHAPRYAASCIVEHGKSGVNAAMLVRDVMEEVLRLDPSRKPRVDEVANVPPAPGEKGSPS